MRPDHKVTKDIFKPAKTLPTIRTATRDKHEIQRGPLPLLKRAVISPSQPHSKTCGR